MSTPDREPAEPRNPRPGATPYIPQPQPSEEDLLELKEPYELVTPEYPDQWLPGLPRRPEYVIVVAASPWVKERFPAARANLWDALQAGKDPQHDPEPDPEAEP